MNITALSYCVLVLISGIVSSHAQDANLIIPKMDDIIGYWPLTNFYKFRDLGPNGFAATLGYGTAYNAAGPYGDANSAYTSSASGVLQVQNPNLTLNETDAVTIAMFFKQTTAIAFPLISFYDSTRGFYNSLTIDVCSSGQLCLCRSSATYATFDYVVDKADWNFLALTVKTLTDNSACTVSLVGRFGYVYKPRNVSSTVCAALKQSTYGFYLLNTQRYTAQTTTSVAGLVIYKSELSESEVMDLYEGQRHIFQAAQCGMTRLPVTPPQNPPQPARPGQFSWVARIKHTTAGHLCSGIILNRYWVLTSLTCMGKPSSAFTGYTVTVGDYDYAVSESFERSHSIRNVYFPIEPYTLTYDIVLLELQTPIDYGNAYVYEACLPSNVNELSNSDTLFTIGWGENGRSSIVSGSVIRYVKGSKLAANLCAKNWTQVPSNSEHFTCFTPQSPDYTAPCNGDVGSPLAKMSDGGYRMLNYAIYSMRGSCQDVSSKPPLYTNIAPFWPWVKSIISCTLPGVNYPINCPL